MQTPIQQPSAWVYQTDNISLAQVLCCLGFPLRSHDPVTIDFDSVNKTRRKKFWFPADWQYDGSNLEASRVENWFNHKAEFEKANPDHPVRFMRAAVDSRQWILSVMNGETRLREVPAGAAKYRVTDIKFASILVAAKYQLLSFERGYGGTAFYFLDDSRLAAKYAEFTESFDPEKPLSNRPMAYMRETLIWGDHLRNLLKHPDLTPQIMMSCKGRPLLISATASRETMHKFFGN